MRTHEVVIIGGSLAGAACVRQLQRLGIDAVAFERDHFPRDKVCGGFVSPGAVNRLNELGVLDEIRREGATEVTSAMIRIDSLEVEIPFRRSGLGISRSALDYIAAKGTAVTQGAAVMNVIRKDSQFLVSGSGFTVVSPVVIDASGKLGRFTRRLPVDEFGVQFFDTGTRPGILDFWFFEDGY